MIAVDGPSRRVRVLGIGNVLLGDDALGPYAANLMLAEYEFDEAVEVLDAGTPGLDLTPYISDVEAVIVMDTVHSDAPPGTLRCYRREQLLAAPPLPRTSPHEPGLREALLATELTDCSPSEILVVGVVPHSTETGTGLSEPVQAALPQVVEAVLAELERLGLPAARRAQPLPPDIWWERRPEAELS